MISPMMTNSPYLNNTVKFKSNNPMQKPETSKNNKLTSQEIVKASFMGAAIGAAWPIIGHMSNSTKINWPIVGVSAGICAIAQVGIYKLMKSYIAKDSNNSN